MNKNKKARKISSPFIKKLMTETSDLQKQQIEDRIQLAMDLDKLVKDKFGSYTNFASHLRRSVSEVSRWLSGTHNLTIATLSEIAMGLGFSLKEMLENNYKKPAKILLVIDNKQVTVENQYKNISKPIANESNYSFNLNA
jgi:transcriptional regulator with XRE-family HTH domain